MRSDQLVAGLLLGLVQKTLQAYVVNFPHAPVPGTTNTIDLSLAGSHNHMQPSDKYYWQHDLQRYKAQGGPPELPPSSITFGPEESKAASGQLEESAVSEELEHQPLNEKFNRKVLNSGS